MHILGKVFAILNLICSVFFLVVAASFFAAQENYKTRWYAESVARVALTDQVSNLNSQLRQAQDTYIRQQARARQELDVHIDAKQAAMHYAEMAYVNYAPLQNSISDTSARVQALQSKVEEFSGTVSRLETESNQYLERYLAALRDKDSIRVQNAMLSRSMASAHQDYSELQGKYYELFREVETLRQEIDMLKELVPGEVVAGIHWPDVRCQVMAVDETVGLVLLSAGRADKMVVGQKMAIYSGDQFKAIVTVERVYPDTCAARIDEATSVRPIQAGDSAMTAN
ncbi:MAG: hypothetical protein NUW37_14870 [Planctomycetes bacterium]|nr:hypothetical protein [Planctomycetota bacterium]